ncbi:AglZ/HisF2 family acetamidino modification protein [Piscinibacter terrae]|uniref:imidazole glycerol-phosphate synthase n=1 Tax=Piscinibacter terrae TaxID=2496871 RepID=A0A3N7IRW7_9BURK|nr:AglZ/HisF2 family acetamidino modification protein [Albitalea terrae]RQP21612.1 imidazole glycerol phosphate synthase subunit HisF [Albitalea terrae]
MLRPRIIPCLLVHKGGLVKTVGFDKPKYVGDPLNAVRIFNEKEVDELMVVDIDATREGRDPDYALIRSMAAECRMPLAYGGGVRTVEQFQRIVGLGVEKVAVSAAAVNDPALITAAAERVGRQSIVVVMDVRRKRSKWEVFTHNGTRATGLDAAEFARRAEQLGAGEIVVNSIDQDGQMKGYDLDLVRSVRGATSRPLTVLGGAGKLTDIAGLVREFGIIGAAAGSLFVFKGIYRAVLINYPQRADKDALIASA